MGELIIELIEKKIQECRRLCFCKLLISVGLASQGVCANCHSKDILKELREEIKKLTGDFK